MKKQTTTIGLDHAESLQLAEKLNILLANYQLLYINTRGFHWNIKGDNFFELHAKFEEIYTDLQIKIDEIAERILTLGQQPLHAYSQYLDQSSIDEITNVTNGKEGLAHVLRAFSVIIELQRELLGLSDEANDEGTNALMSDYIREQEKLAWMYNAYLG